MDSFTFDRYPAQVKFSSSKKSCFLTVPAKWIEHFSTTDLRVYKIKYGGKEAYMSCGTEFTHRKDLESMVFMNKKFAEKLGIKEKELVELEPMSYSNPPTAVEVVIEPLTHEDWTAMQLNSSYIENILLDQIRVIWVNQVFPLWVNNYSIYWRVVATKPNHKPVVLFKETILTVVSEGLDTPSPTHSIKDASKRPKSDYDQFQFLRNCLKSEQSFESSDSDENVNSENTDTFLSQSIASYISPLTSWFASPTSDESSLSLEEPEIVTDIYDFNFDSVLRVLPYTNPVSNISSVVQATTVFISASTFVAYCGDNEIPSCFVGVLEKYSLPEKKLRKGINDNGGKTLQSDSRLAESTLPKNEDKTKLNSDTGQKPFDSICVAVMVIKSAEEDEFGLPPSLFTYKNAIVVPKELKRALNLEVANLAHLRSTRRKPLPLYKLVFHPVTMLSPNITEKVIQEHFSKWAFGKDRKHHTFIISDGTLVKLKIHSRKCEFFIHLGEREINKNNYDSSYGSLEPEKSIDLESEREYGLLTHKMLKKLPIKVGATMCMTIYDDRPFLLKESGMYCDIKATKLTSLGGIKELSVKAVEDIKFWLKLRPLSYISNHSSTYSGCILICGPKGVGKSSFANALCKKFVEYPYHVLVRSIQCLSLKGKRVDTIAKKWDSIISEAIYGQPSLILFENLDYIASAPLSPEQENGPDGVYFSSICQVFINTMHRIISSESKIVVIATSESLHSLHPSLVNTKGRHIFQRILEVTPPNADQRANILLALLCNRPHISKNTVRNVNILDIAAKTEGYVAQDLSTLVDRATHAAWVRMASNQEQEQITLKSKDFAVALKGLTPSSLRGISLQTQEQRTWKDVGGLNEVKKVIQQIIMWPTKYKEMYKNYSLKPQTNILLYGAPGTGKTLLAGVVASECGLNFISIKGPELLSKYIGASEQAVRDLFKRATTARPCILFFDEFDSIAPRRGHDSTGVTDRVVNQLLTQLDGVESLEGVHVLAATSRPELIDPALLRPGRLDKCLLCPLPNKKERIEILQCLASRMNLSEDVNFEDIASLTENFSGADLQALLYTAHIQALHEVQYTSTNRYMEDSEDKDYKRASENVLYMPNIEEGLKKPSFEDGKKIVQDVTVVRENYFGVRVGGRQARRNSTLIVYISQRHLLEAKSEMKPSVSFEERLRYELVFKDFRNTLTKGGDPPASPGNVKRVTLA